MCVGILWVFLYQQVEVINCFFMVFNHLIGFCSLVDKAYLWGVELNAFWEWVNGFLKLFNHAVCKTDVIINICFIWKEWFVDKRSFEWFDTCFEITGCILWQAKPIVNLWVIFPYIKTFIQILNWSIILSKIIMALRSMH